MISGSGGRRDAAGGRSTRSLMVSSGRRRSAERLRLRRVEHLLGREPQQRRGGAPSPEGRRNHWPLWIGLAQALSNGSEGSGLPLLGSQKHGRMSGQAPLRLIGGHLASALVMRARTARVRAVCQTPARRRKSTRATGVRRISRTEGCQNSDCALNRGLTPFTNARSRRPAPRGVALSRTPRAPPKPRDRADR